MLKTLTLSLLAIACFAGEADKKPSAADVLYDKAVAENTKDAERNYDVYLKSLEVANKKVIAALESAVNCFSI